MFFYEVKDPKSLFFAVQIDPNLITIYYRDGISHREKNLIPRTNRYGKQFVCIKEGNPLHIDVFHLAKRDHHHHHLPYSMEVSFEDWQDLMDKFSVLAVKDLNLQTDKTRDVVYHIHSDEIKELNEKLQKYFEVQKKDKFDKKVANDTNSSTLVSFQQYKQSLKSSSSTVSEAPELCDVTVIRKHINELLGQKYIDKHVNQLGEALWVLDDKDPKKRTLTQSLLIPRTQESRNWYEKRLTALKDFVRFDEIDKNGVPKYTITIHDIDKLGLTLKNRPSAKAGEVRKYANP